MNLKFVNQAGNEEINEAMNQTGLMNEINHITQTNAVNQSTNHTINQKINQSINPSIHPSINQSNQPNPRTKHVNDITLAVFPTHLCKPIQALDLSYSGSSLWICGPPCERQPGNIAIPSGQVKSSWPTVSSCAKTKLRSRWSCAEAFSFADARGCPRPGGRHPH